MPASEPVAFNDIWLAETVRLREEHWGSLQDTDAIRQARIAPGPLEARVLLRARLLGQREGLPQHLRQWRSAAGIAFVLLLAAALLAGLSAALGALGDGSRPVNVVWAVGALLGLHALTFLLWLLSFAGGQPAGGGLARLWLWAARKLARGPDAALPAQALVSLLARAHAMRWLFGAISHLIWLVALGAALLALVAVLSTAHYSFAWSTTLLSADAFVALTRTLGWLPAQLGFPVPDAALVRISDGTQVLPAAAQAQWAMWLLGTVAVYGVLPRLLAWLASIAGLRRAARGLRVDMALPGYAVLRDRLQPPAEALVTGEEAGHPTADTPNGVASHRIASHHALAVGAQAVLVGLELPGDIEWPPAASGTDSDRRTYVAGNLDTREQRNTLLDALAATPAARLLIACDARQTPDRGTLALIADLASKAAQTRVWLTPGAPDRMDTWRARLEAAGMPAEAIMRDADEPLQWLEQHDA
jgi:hypothetical protein